MKKAAFIALAGLAFATPAFADWTILASGVDNEQSNMFGAMTTNPAGELLVIRCSKGHEFFDLSTALKGFDVGRSYFIAVKGSNRPKLVGTMGRVTSSDGDGTTFAFGDDDAKVVDYMRSQGAVRFTVDIDSSHSSAIEFRNMGGVNDAIAQADRACLK